MPKINNNSIKNFILFFFERLQYNIIIFFGNIVQMTWNVKSKYLVDLTF